MVGPATPELSRRNRAKLAVSRTNLVFIGRVSASLVRALIPSTIQKSESFKKMKKSERIARRGCLKTGMITIMADAKDDPYPTRPTLLGRLKDTQDQASWQEFHDIYAKLIRGFCLKAGLTADEAQEVVQETMISAARHLPEYSYNPKVCSF